MPIKNPKVNFLKIKKQNQIFHKYFLFQKCLGEELDKAAPLRKGEGNSWQCPFCGQDDFPELTEVWNHFDAG